MALLAQKKKGLMATENLLPLFVVISLALNGLSLLAIVGLSAVVTRLANRPVPTLVQTVNGESILTESMDHLDRTPETIRRFTQQTLTAMFTWNPVQGNAASGRVVADQGMEVGSSRVTTKSWQSSFAFAEDFRAPFLEEVGAMTPPSIFNGGAQSVFNIESLSEPRRLGAGQWEIEVVANLIIFNQQNSQGVAIPFNKVVYLQAVEPPSDPLAAEATAVQQAVYRVRSSGLQVVQMTELVGGRDGT